MNGLVFSILVFCRMSFCDCFQDLAEKVENGLIAENTSIVDSFPILLSEIESCTGSTGTDLYEIILNNLALLECGKAGDPLEITINRILTSHYPIDIKDIAKIMVLKWYENIGKIQDFYFNRLNFIDVPQNDMYSLYKNFALYDQLLKNEVNMNTVLSQALTDYMFKRSPGQALLLLNSTLSSEEIENVKNTIDPLIKWHSWRNPKSWEDEDLDSGKATINNLISSNYAYIDLFIAEIVNVVHDLRTPEVDAFLKQSTHPLVQKRENEPFVYVPLVVPE